VLAVARLAIFAGIVVDLLIRDRMLLDLVGLHLELGIGLDEVIVLQRHRARLDVEREGPGLDELLVGPDLLARPIV